MDAGVLPEEARGSFEGGLDAMGWVEADQEKLDRPEQGWLWIHQAAW